MRSGLMWPAYILALLRVNMFIIVITHIIISEVMKKIMKDVKHCIFIVIFPLFCMLL